MKSVIAAIFAIAASAVSAQTIVSSQPSTSQVLTAGSTTKIVWTPVSGTISTIDLRKGAASALTFVSNVATNVDASLGTYSWSIDSSLATGTDYALSFGQSPNVSYTPFFTIQAASGSTGSTTSAASSAAAVTSSAATTSGSSAATTKAASSAASSASAATTSTSAANKNVAAMGVAAVAGVVAAALI